MAVLVAIGRMAAICAFAGLALYLGLSAFAEGVAAAHLWLAFGLGGPLFALMAFQIATALRDGEIHAGRLVVYSREHQPFLYRLHLALHAAMAAILLAILAFAARHLLAG